MFTTSVMYATPIAPSREFVGICQAARYGDSRLNIAGYGRVPLLRWVIEAVWADASDLALEWFRAPNANIYFELRPS